MRTLIIEDDEANRKLLGVFLSPYGVCDSVDGGEKGIAKFKESLEKNTYYDLICLDIMMPDMDGITVLKNLRTLEAEHGLYGSTASKIIMMTAVNDKNVVINAFREGCEAYVIKPLDREELLRQLRVLKLIQ